MATKEEVLRYITMLAEQQIISKDELDVAYSLGCKKTTNSAQAKNLGIAEILYFIGGAIVFFGIMFLVAQNWSTLNFTTKALVTLGSGVISYIAGLLFSRQEKTGNVGLAFYLISALVTPLGLYVVINNSGFEAGHYILQSIISGILLVVYFLSYLFSRKNIFALFSILFGTWLFFSLTSWLAGAGISDYDLIRFYCYRVLIAGLAYILISYLSSKNKPHPLSGFLYGFGIFGLLSAALMLSGWKSQQYLFWDLIYPVLVFAALFFSISIKSKSFLTWGTIFLMLYIIKITLEYFFTGLGWPLALIIAGLAMIAVGYMSISIKKKYLTV